MVARSRGGDLSGLLVEGGGSVLEAAATLPEFVTPALLRLDPLTADLLPAPQKTYFVGGGNDGLEIVVIVGIRRLRLRVITSHARRELINGVVSGVAGNARTDPRLHLPDCMLSEDNSPRLRLTRAAGYTPLDGVYLKGGRGRRRETRQKCRTDSRQWASSPSRESKW